MDTLVEFIIKSISEDYCEYIPKNTRNKYYLIEENGKETYGFNLKLSKNKSYLIIKNLEKLKEKLSYDGRALNKLWVSKDCDYIIIIPEDKTINFIELKKTKNSSNSNTEVVNQIKGGVFWLHLIYISLLWREKEILNFKSLEDENWKFKGFLIQGKSGRNNHKKQMKQSTIKVNCIGNTSASFPIYSTTIDYKMYFNLSQIVKKGQFSKHNKKEN